MTTKRQLLTSYLAAIVIGGGVLGAGMPMAQAIGISADTSEGMEVMTRGPVHEAFAGTVVFDPTPGIIVPSQPPALIEEVPPDERPAGDNVAWIPGYWGWDEDQSDFLWVSGIWRNLPPDREWVPGYWSPVDTGYHWTSGYWQDAQATEITYLPEPPRSVERGPSVSASSDDETWIPGNWRYQQDHYAWRAGYWVNARPNWSWIPSCYRWTPCGYVYVDGYWDYPVVNRGVVFAPVRFQRDYCERPDFYYTPVVSIALSLFTNHLFLRPSYGHYYYGDYYEPRYHDRYYSWSDYGTRYRGYDPIYAYARWENRNDRNWGRERQSYYEYRRDNVSARPPRTWAALNSYSEVDRRRDDFGVVERYDRVVQRKDSSRQFQKVSSDERQRFVSQKNEIRNYGRERQQKEITAVRTKGDKVARTEVSRVKMSRSPVVSQRSDRSEKNGGPPPRLEKRASEKVVSQSNALASKDARNDKASKAGRSAQETAKASSGQADKRGGNAVAKSMVEPNRETRTQPGQRRDAVASSKGKSPQGADSNSRANNKPEGRTELDRKATASATSKLKAEPKRSSAQADRKLDSPRVSSERKPTDNRPANPNVQRKESPSPKREAAPQPQRKSVPQEVKKPARQEAPSRKAMAAPTRQAPVSPARKPTQKAAPQRAEARPQQKAQPQRQPAPRPEPRKAQPAPQRQKSAPAPRPEPQRQKAQPAPRREPTRSAPQRQPARPSPQPQKADPRPQSTTGSTSKTEASADPRTESKKKRK